MIRLGLIYFFFIHNTLNAQNFEEKKLEIFISKKEILKNVKQYQKGIPPKVGYKGSKTWNVLIDYTAERKDKKLFKSFLSKVYVNPRKRTEYRNDMYKLLTKNPQFFIRSFDQFYNKNKECLNWFFDKDKHSLHNLKFNKMNIERLDKIDRGIKASAKNRKACIKIRNQKLQKDSHVGKS